MAEHSIVRLAEQGDPKAIAYLITHSLKKYGITARAARKQGCLKLLLEAEQLPHQATMVKLIGQGMQKLNPASLHEVKIYGRRLDQPAPAWRQVIELSSLRPTGLAADRPEAALSEEEATQIFQLDDLDPEAMILLPIEPQVQLDDLNPDTLILFPLEPPAPTKASSSEHSASVPPFFQAGHQTGYQIDYQASSPWENNGGPVLPAPDREFASATGPEIRPEVEPVSSLEGNPTYRADYGSDHGADHTALPEPEAEPERYPASDSLPARLPKRLPGRLTRLLLGLLWAVVLINSFGLIYAALGAGSLSLYRGLDLSNTNQPFASLLAAVVGIAAFIFTPFSQANLWIALAALILSLVWLHRIHASLRDLLEGYPISPAGAVVRFLLPGLNLWGVGNTISTLARRLGQTELEQGNLEPVEPGRASSTPPEPVRPQTGFGQVGQTLRRLAVWLYLTLFAVIALTLLASPAIQSGLLALLAQADAPPISDAFNDTLAASLEVVTVSPWYGVARSAAIWLCSLVWLRLVRVVWRAVRRLYRLKMAPFLPPKPERRARKPSPVSLRAILLGSGTSLLSLTLVNCLLGLIAALVFVSNGLRPEAIVPTFYDSESLLILVLLGSLVSVGLGGFLATHLARQNPLLHALGLGIFLTVIGLLLQRSLPLATLIDLPFWFQTASTALIIPAALLGGWICRWLKSLN